MKRFNWNTILLVAVIGAATIFYLRGLPAVPFHPDESTQLFMSSDARQFLRDPSQLFFQKDRQNDPRQRYRLLDAPLTRDMIGIGLAAQGLRPLPSDWNWSATWEENQASGALPSARQLDAARLSVAILFPLTLLFAYGTGAALGGRLGGWAMLLLLASNSLILLHTRRAMAESALVFATVLTLYALARPARRPWLLAIAVALAFNAKQVALPLLLPGLLAVVWPVESGQRPSLRDRLLNVALFVLVFAGVTLLLNPVFWSAPLSTVLEALQARADFTQGQVQTMQSLGSTIVMNSPLERLAGAIVQLFIAPPSMAEAGNYLTQTQAATDAYLSVPVHTLFRGLIAGGVMLFLFLFGLVAGGLQAIRERGSARGRVLALLVIATLVQFLAITLMLPLPFQRYYLVLVPFACLWIAFGLAHMIRQIYALSRSALSARISYLKAH